MEIADNWQFDRRAQFALKRDKLLRVAAGCFNRKGHSGTSLKDVAALLNLTDAALYYYVKNKQELVYECYKRAAELGWEAMQQGREEGTDGLGRVERYLHHHIEAFCGPRGPIAIMSEIPALDEAHRNDILKRSRRHSVAFEALLQEGIDDGSIAQCDVRMTGNAIMGALNWIPKWFHNDDLALAGQISTEFASYLVRGLRN